MAYLPAPHRPEVISQTAWSQAMRDVDREISVWVQRMKNGSNPLKVGERRRLQSLIASAHALGATDPHAAQIAAATWGKGVVASQKALDATLKSVPGHVAKSSAEFYKQTGWTNVVDRDALSASISRSQQKITKDFDRLDSTIQRKITQSVRDSVAFGTGPDDMARRLRDATQGSLGLGLGRSKLIARTELADAYDSARSGLYSKYGTMGLLYGWEWDARNDACPICEALDGRIFQCQEPPNRHHYCRCISIPVLPDDVEAQTPYGGYTKRAQNPSPEVAAMRDRLFQRDAPGWRSYWAKGSPEDVARWKALRPGLPPQTPVSFTKTAVTQRAVQDAAKAAAPKQAETIASEVLKVPWRQAGRSEMQTALAEMEYTPRQIQAMMTDYHVMTNGTDYVLVPSGAGNTAERLCNALSDVLKEVPAWRRVDPEGRVRPFTVIADNSIMRQESAGHAMASGFTYRGSQTIYLDPSLLDTRGWIPQSKFSSTAFGKHGGQDHLHTVLTHEMGHCMDPGGGTLPSSLRRHMSMYGMRNRDEGVAEAFVEWVYGNRSNPAVQWWAKQLHWDENSDTFWSTMHRVHHGDPKWVRNG